MTKPVESKKGSFLPKGDMHKGTRLAAFGLAVAVVSFGIGMAGWGLNWKWLMLTGWATGLVGWVIGIVGIGIQWSQNFKMIRDQIHKWFQ